MYKIFQTYFYERVSKQVKIRVTDLTYISEVRGTKIICAVS
jgi:hypothetical protein